MVGCRGKKESGEERQIEDCEGREKGGEDWEHGRKVEGKSEGIWDEGRKIEKIKKRSEG